MFVSGTTPQAAVCGNVKLRKHNYPACSLVLNNPAFLLSSRECVLKAEVDLSSFYRMFLSSQVLMMTKKKTAFDCASITFTACL